MKNALFALFLGVLLWACSGKQNKANLPTASGATGEIFLFMDSAQWQRPVGAAMDSLFNHEMIGLPRDEGIFKMKWINPVQMNFVLKQRKNIIYMMSLDNQERGSRIVKGLFTPESLIKIEQDTNIFILTQQDVFAKGQEVMFLFSKTEQGLLKKVREKGPQLVEYFNKVERKRLTEGLFKAGTLKGASDWVKQNFNVEIQIPYGYKLVQNEKDFLWVRQINPKDDKDVFISVTNYTSADQFKQENLIAYRNEVCRKYLFEDPDMADSYLLTETAVPFVPVTSRQINFNGRFAIEMRGLWRTNNKSMGGPFLSYAVADEVTGKFYYIEGFTFSPGKSQREIMRELETIMYTFKLPDSPSARK